MKCWLYWQNRFSLENDSKPTRGHLSSGPTSRGLERVLLDNTTRRALKYTWLGHAQDSGAHPHSLLSFVLGKLPGGLPISSTPESSPWLADLAWFSQPACGSDAHGLECLPLQTPAKFQSLLWPQFGRLGSIASSVCALHHTCPQQCQKRDF